MLFRISRKTLQTVACSAIVAIGERRFACGGNKRNDRLLRNVRRILFIVSSFNLHTNIFKIRLKKQCVARRRLKFSLPFARSLSLLRCHSRTVSRSFSPSALTFARTLVFHRTNVCMCTCMCARVCQCVGSRGLLKMLAK